MFRVPNAKRVRREDLYSASVSPRSSLPDRDVKVLLNKHYAGLVKLPIGEASSVPEAVTDASHGHGLDQVDLEEQDAYEFRLFAKPAAGPHSGDIVPTKATRIVLRSPSPVIDSPGFIQPRRPDSYYFTTEATAENKSRYDIAALSGEAVRAGQLRRWPGCELPWRVVTIKLSSTGSAKLLAVTSDTQAGKKRAGKKRRIILRKRFGLEKAKKAALSMSKVKREAAEREKRTRRNREKKVKKKEKEKLKKAAGA